MIVFRRIARWACGPAGAAALAALFIVAPAGAQGRDSRVGPTDVSCTSSFARGYSNCAVQPTAAVATSSTAAASAPVAARREERATAVSDTDVDAYLANHGKPSREAVRALLDPTDENIAAMARRVRQDAAIAAYVAARMTALQDLDPGLVAINPAFNSEDLPWLSGMRVVLHVGVGCRRCELAAQTLQRLVAESPVLDARLVVHGAASVNAMALELARLGVTLPAMPAAPEDSRLAPSTPIAIVADMRYGRMGALAQFGTTHEMRTAVASFRRLAVRAEQDK